MAAGDLDLLLPLDLERDLLRDLLRYRFFGGLGLLDLGLRIGDGDFDFCLIPAIISSSLRLRAAFFAL